MFKDCDQQIFIDFCNIFSSDFSNDLHLDFGEVALGSTGRLYLHIRNESAIAAPYTVGVEHFIARPPTPPQEPLDRNMSTGQRRALLQKTPNLADPMARTLNKAANGKKLSLSVKLLHLIIDVITANYFICFFGDVKKLIMVIHVFAFNFSNIFGKQLVFFIRFDARMERKFVDSNIAPHKASFDHLLL